MVVIPNHQPLIEGLSSYYLKITRFIEHHQSAIGSCGIHMKSAHVEGMAYYDSGHLLGAICQTIAGTVFDEEAIQQLISATEKHNFTVSVYQIEPDMIYFWANAMHATPVHRDLTTDITDLDRLIAKMVGQQLTGFIEVLIADGAESGILLFNSGQIIGASTSPGGARETFDQVRRRLVEETSTRGGTFHVSTISAREKSGDNPIKRDPSKANNAEAGLTPPAAPAARPVDALPIVEELLSLGETVCIESKRVKDFPIQFRKAAMKLADKYSFLDPFLKEFEYSDGRLRLQRNVPPQTLAAGVLECIQNMMTALGLTSQFKAKADGWLRANAKSLKGLGVNLN